MSLKVFFFFNTEYWLYQKLVKIWRNWNAHTLLMECVPKVIPLSKLFGSFFLI